MSEQKKRNNKESMICLTPKQAKKSEIIGVSLSPSPNLNSLDYAIWGFLENKTNASSHPNIGSLKTAIEEKWGKMSEEIFEDMQIVSKACWYKNCKKWWPYWVNLLFCISILFCCLFFQIKINLVL